MHRDAIVQRPTSSEGPATRRKIRVGVPPEDRWLRGVERLQQRIRDERLFKRRSVEKAGSSAAVSVLHVAGRRRSRE